MELFVLVSLILFNGVFAMAELASSPARRFSDLLSFVVAEITSPRTTPVENVPQSSGLP
jgi:hypothetical protein